jgi:hypothetical protein
VEFERCEDNGEKSVPKFIPSSNYQKEEEALKPTKTHYPFNPKSSFNLKREVKRESPLVVIRCIYLPPTYLHFMQDIEDRCLLLMSSTRFVDLPFQKHRMMEKHHMDQNSYISLLCSKLGVVSDNMTRGDDMAKSLGPTDPRWGQSAPLLGRPARVWR